MITLAQPSLHIVTARDAVIERECAKLTAAKRIYIATQRPPTPR